MVCVGVVARLGIYLGSSIGTFWDILGPGIGDAPIFKGLNPFSTEDGRCVGVVGRLGIYPALSCPLTTHQTRGTALSGRPQEVIAAIIGWGHWVKRPGPFRGTRSKGGEILGALGQGPYGTQGH